MKRALLISVLTAFGLAAVACSESGDTLTSGKQTDKDETETPVSKKSDTKNTVDDPPAQQENKPTTQTPPATSTPAPANPSDCSAQADFKSCATCCGTNNGPVNTCACGASAACAQACAGNLCDAKTPSIACALCLAQSDCDFSFGGDQGGAQNSPAAQCLQQCATKFGQQ